MSFASSVIERPILFEECAFTQITCPTGRFNRSSHRNLDGAKGA